MIIETGTVVALESDALWVETIQKTACEACVAQKGCGTRVLSKLTGKTNRIRVLANRSCADLKIGQDVRPSIVLGNGEGVMKRCGSCPSPEILLDTFILVLQSYGYAHGIPHTRPRQVLHS